MPPGPWALGHGPGPWRHCWMFMCIFMYVYVYLCMYMYVYVYVYVYLCIFNQLFDIFPPSYPLRRYGPRPRNNNTNNSGSLTNPASTCAGMKYRGRHKPSLQSPNETVIGIYTYVQIIKYNNIS